MQLKRLSRNDIPLAVQSVLRILNENGFYGVIVGGAVRDLLLGRSPKEFDIATNARPPDIAGLFDAVSMVGRAYGTVVIRFEGTTMDVTTFRREAHYTDRRHPNDVAFVGTLSDDMSRRDFTMNAMAFDPLKHELLDQYNGRDHLCQGQLVCVGDPYQRFREDTLRPFRAFRFQSEYGVSFRDDTHEALATVSSCMGASLTDSGLDGWPSSCRIRRELHGILMGPNWHTTIKRMDDMGWLCPWLTRRSEWDDHHHVPHDALARWAWLMTLDSVDEWARFFCFSKTDARRMTAMIQWQFDLDAVDLTVHDLALSSHTLQSMGYSGREMGQVQRAVLDAVRRKAVANHASNIHQWIKREWALPR